MTWKKQYKRRALLECRELTSARAIVVPGGRFAGRRRRGLVESPAMPGSRIAASLLQPGKGGEPLPRVLHKALPHLMGKSAPSSAKGCWVVLVGV